MKKKTKQNKTKQTNILGKKITKKETKQNKQLGLVVCHVVHIVAVVVFVGNKHRNLNWLFALEFDHNIQSWMQVLKGKKKRNPRTTVHLTNKGKSNSIILGFD